MKELTEEQQLCEVLRIEGLDGPWCGYAYSYDGPPEYAEEHKDYDHEYKTVVAQFLWRAPKDCLEDEQGYWTRVQTFTTSGETECPCRYHYCADNDIHGDGDDMPKTECETCEGGGFIYVGDGWAEVVYRRMSPFEVMAMHNDPYAVAYAQIFSVAHDDHDIWPCIRLLRKRGDLPQGDYIEGRYWKGWQFTFEDTEDFERLRDLAQEFLDELSS